MRKRAKRLCSVLLVATIGLTGCGQKQKTESTAEKADENHFYPKVYKDSLFPQAIYKIGNDEELISKRLDEE